jgi:hypothetical protein
MPRLQNRVDDDGAIIRVRIELGREEADWCRAAGEPIPPPFPTTALIDIGASRTAVDPMILRHLGAIQTEEASVHVPGHHPARIPIYRVRITLENQEPTFANDVLGIVPATPTVAVLIGRDVLERGTLLYDGENDAFSLWYGSRPTSRFVSSGQTSARELKVCPGRRVRQK